MARTYSSNHNRVIVYFFVTRQRNRRKKTCVRGGCPLRIPAVAALAPCSREGVEIKESSISSAPPRDGLEAVISNAIEIFEPILWGGGPPWPLLFAWPEPKC